MDKLVKLLAADFPQFTFCKSDVLYWSPRTKEIFYKAGGERSGLLHELGHGLLGHQAFQTDFELMQMEVAAWQRARELCATYDVPVNESYIQHCLDSYRDWLDRRSVCPTCSSHGLQSAQRLYMCANCQRSWHVSASVLCRPYRQSTQATKEKSPAV